jgi:two-component system, OmpR family, alkaline phosphatase synthesis response regulator PhoP
LTPQEEKPLPPSNVLVVDDNSQNLELLMAYMEGLDNIAVSGATDGEEAMLRVRSENPPDLILLDVMMPKMSGFEVCRQIKSNPRTRNIQVIMVTALNEVGDRERAADCGTDEFLTKPVNRAELITRVKNLLQLRHLKRELEQTMSMKPDQRPGQSPEVS